MLSPRKKLTINLISARLSKSINLISARLSKSINLIQSWKFHLLKKDTRKMNKIIKKKIKQEQTLIPKSIRFACD